MDKIEVIIHRTGTHKGLAHRKSEKLSSRDIEDIVDALEYIKGIAINPGRRVRATNLLKLLK